MFISQEENQESFEQEGLNDMSVSYGIGQGRPQNLPRELMHREPAVLWDSFARLATLPRESGQEQHVQEWLKDLARQEGWQVKEDKTGNLVLSVPGRGAGRDAEPVVIQAHMDMVCVKEPGHQHDFSKDAIELQVTQHASKGEILEANGTTLGADNGIGLCAGIAAALSDEITDCPPLELLMTVDEERGLTGALHLDASIVTGRKLLNLDTEESHRIYMSCAGSRDMIATWDLKREPAQEGFVPVKLSLTGLGGGHSGTEIQDARGNSIKMMLGAVDFCIEQQGGSLAHLEGGSRRNVIPSTAEAIVWVPKDSVDTISQTLSGTAFTGLLSSVDPAFGQGKIAVTELDSALEPLTKESEESILLSLFQVPHGVHEWSQAVQGLVETSNNLAQVTMTESTCELQCMTRSSKPGAVDQFQKNEEAHLLRSGASVSFTGESPAWEADTNSALLKKASKVFEAETGVEQEIVAIHAGLECGAFKQLMPDIDMISFGPAIHEAHTVNEYIVIESVEPFWKSLKGLLKSLCDDKLDADA